MSRDTPIIAAAFDRTTPPRTQNSHRLQAFAVGLDWEEQEGLKANTESDGETKKQKGR